ncbi:sickle tail protein isoform X3 [Astyanax mexicanus]|uniref:sickle tail protein isoform X3 n=1 Tax=Astyanax mexicanus TaxID=7994 RepID=UPI0020CAF2B2|nr:sickle tail protein isoform X3 [Astyanax mexicanus]
MSRPSRLTRPSSAAPGSKLPSPRRETPSSRHRSSQNDKLMQTDAEGSLSRHSPSANGATHSQRKSEEESGHHKSRNNSSRGTTATLTQQAPGHHKPLKGNLKVTSPEDAEHLHRKQPAGGAASTGASANGPGVRGDPKGSRAGVSRRHTVGGARSSREILAMQPSDMDKKREAFLEHLKQKYPHHASAIMGHQERLREQTRSPKQGAACPCPSPVPSSLGEQLEQGSLISLDALEVMSECDAPLGFTRGSRSRASLPVVRSANQTKDRSLGVLYLQYGDDMKQIRMPNEITSADTVRALFVSAFPQQLSMKMLESPSTAIYVKDDMRNMYYELSDVRSITDQACLKVYHKDPAHAFSHGARPSNGDARMHREVMYAAPPLMRQHSLGPPPPHAMQGPPHAMQGPMSPPTPHSMPPSPSRIPFGPRVSGGGSTTMPRERAGHNLATPTRSASPCASAILERRDVKPDEDIAAKSMSLPARNEGLYADPYLLQHPDMVDHGFHRVPVRPYGPPGTPIEPPEHHSLFRQKSRKYADSQLPTLGSKTPPPSPHRMGEMRVMDIHTGQSQAAAAAVTLERSSPVRQSFRKEAPVSMDMVVKGRGVMASPVTPVTPVTPDLQAHGPVVPSADPLTRERMKAMEEQLASLTGLVQHALLQTPSSNGCSGGMEQASDRSVKSGSPVHSTSSAGNSPVLGPKSAAVPPERSPALTPPLSSAPLQVNLHQFRRNVSDLRVQLQQMRQIQLQNQECVRVQMKQVEQEISARLSEALRRQEDPSHRQRAAVEEERHAYLCMEEKVLTQLGDLESYVESLKRDWSSGLGSRVSLKEVEEGAVSLRKVGESLAGLKGEFPALQGRMRAVLRVEVEAVKFLKEEPHKLDSMLKRVKTLTDSLSTLRRCATEGSLKPSDVSTTSSTPTADGVESAPPSELQDTSSPPVTELQTSSVKSELINSNPTIIHHAQSSPVPLHQSQHSAGPPSSAPPQPARDSAPSPTKRSGSPRQLKKPGQSQPEATPPSSNGVSAANGASPGLFIEEITSHGKIKNRATSIEAAEKEWEEKRHNISHYDGREFQKVLQEAEATMLRGIPSLEAANEGENSQKPAVEETVERPEPSATAAQDSQPEPPTPEKPSKTGPEKAPKPHPERVAKAAGLERPPKPGLTSKTSLERAAKPPDKPANKSPPPPPPRRNYPTTTGMTTTRSGEVIYTSKKEPAAPQEVEGDPQPKLKNPPETKPKPITPPPVTASSIPEEEDEGDKIMAELQVFQKCSNKDLGLKGLVEPQIRELRPGALLPLRDKKQNTETQEEKYLLTDENGNNTVRQSPGVIYYVTAQITKDTSEESADRTASQPSPSQVSHVNASEKSQKQQQVSTEGSSGKTKNKVPENTSSLPSALPHKQLTRPSSLKSKPKSSTEEGPLSPTRGKVHVVKAPQVQVSVEEKVESPTSVCSPVSLGSFDPNLFQANTNPDKLSNLSSAKPQPVLGSSKARDRKYEDVDDNDDCEAFLSPDLPGGEPPPPPDNIAFMITNTKVQALSTGEYQELVNAKRGNVQTVTVGNKPQSKHGPNSNMSPGSVTNSNGSEEIDSFGFNKKPVIIIFDEPMDIRSAYKRLSTVFECEEELERMLAEERIEEESEENEEEEDRNREQGDKTYSGKASNGTSNSFLVGGDSHISHISSNSTSSPPQPQLSDEGEPTDANADAKQDAKKKFKFKFPKKQLAALTQAIRTGTKTGKKTLQVVVYEDEEESDGTVKQHKEAKRFEIARSKQESSKSEISSQESQGRTDEIRKSTYKTLDSLEQTIKQLESTISEMGPKSSEDQHQSENSRPREREASYKGIPSKTSSPKPSLSSKAPSLRKKPKPQLLPRPVVIPTTGVSIAPAPTQQNASVASPTSRMPVPMSAKARQQPGTSDRERATKQQKLQDSGQRQFRQANGSAKRSGGDPKSTSSSTSSSSKIPAFSSSTGKGASQSDATTNQFNPSSNAPSSSSSSNNSSNSKSSIPTPRSIPAPSSHIPSLSNGSLKLAPPTHSTKGLSLSTQTQNGRPSSSSSSSSSSSHSPLSPTMLTQGVKSIRTIHTPSFVSYTRPHNGNAGNSGKSAIPTPTAVAKEAS